MAFSFVFFVVLIELFPQISELIDLARWIKFDPSFITWLVLVVLSGTEFNRRINFNPGLARFNPRLALIGFPGTRAWCFSACRVDYENHVCLSK